MAQKLILILEERFPQSGTKNNYNCVAHFLDPSAKGVLLHEFEKYEDTKKYIIEMSQKYKSKEQPTPAETVDETHGDENDKELSGIERLLKRGELVVISQFVHSASLCQLLKLS